MSWKLRVGLAVIATGLVAAFFFYRAPLQPPSVAKSPDDGMVMPGTNGKARMYPNNVIRIEPEGFAVTTALRDLPDAKDQPAEQSAEYKLEKAREEQRDRDRQAKGLPPLTEREKEQWEINDRNTERVKRNVPGAGLADRDFTDPLAALSVSPKAPQAMPTPSLTFDGAGMADNSSAGAGTGFSPPDTNGDVGPNHYVSSINLVLKVYNKNGTVAAPAKKTSDLFASLPATDPCRTRNDGDPVVIYDSLADRWVVTQFSLPAGISGSGTNNYQCMAVSTTADPTGTYYVWSYVYPGNALNDYPKPGVWPDAYHYTFNQFNNAGTSFLGMGIMSQDRPKALAGDPTTSVVYKNFFSLDPNAGGALPTDFDGNVPPPAGLAEVFAEFRAVSNGDPLNAIRFYKWVPNFLTPASSTLTVLPDVPVAAWDVRSPTSAVMEVLSGGTLDGLNDRLMHRLAYRNLGTYASPVNSYVGNLTVNVSGVAPTSAATYQGAVRWWEMRRTGDAFTVNDQGTQSTGAGNGATGTNNWMGSIAQDYQGNIALGYSQSSTTQRADIKTAGRTGAPSGSLDQGEALMYAAPASQTSGSRWGDYSSMSIDPSDDCTFWYMAEYYAAASTTGFSSRVGSFKYPGCTAAPKGTISGTITSCATTLPITAASVDATGGFNRLTIANGTYSMTVAPGSYTVGANKSGGYTGTTANTTVTNGGTSTVNICLSGVPVLAAGSTSIVAESCGIPNNGAPDPGENVTVSLPFTNTGAANTANLTATLQATGGIINPGPAQNYGVVTVGGPAVSKNFTFTVDPGVTCGNTITLTWTLADGAASYGNVTKTYGTGTANINLSQNFDAVTAPALPAGWTQNQTSGTGITWVTSTTTPNSAPNTAFANDPATVNAAAIESPVFPVSVSNASLSFQKAFTTESTFDGAVLEIKIGAGAWTDIVAAGGVFGSGGYNATISSSFSSPIAGRQAWSGTSATFTPTTVTLPASANGQNVQLRWLMASDSSVASTGFRLDDVSVSAGVSCSACALSIKSRADFDGDGKTDVSVYRPSDGNWYLSRSTAGFSAIHWGGNAGDVIVPGDYDGDGKADYAIWRPSDTPNVTDFYILNSNGFTVSGYSHGLTTDIPVPGDFDGDGKSDIAVWRPSTGTWWIYGSLSQTTTGAQFGSTGDIPMSMDSDGDGKANLAVFRPSNNTWYIARNTGVPAQNFDAVQWGQAGDVLVPADYDGDNKDDVAVFRPSNGVWYIRRSTDSGVTFTQFGQAGDIAVPGDYDGDGKDDVAVYRGGTWYLNRSTSGFAAVAFGAAGDSPIPAAYHP